MSHPTPSHRGRRITPTTRGVASPTARRRSSLAALSGSSTRGGDPIFHPTALPGALAVACAVLIAASSGAHASASRFGQGPSPAFEAFRQMERDLTKRSGPPAHYLSNGQPSFGLRVYETN